MAIHLQINKEEVSSFTEEKEGRFTYPRALNRSVKNRWVSLFTDMRDETTYIGDIKITSQELTEEGTVFTWKA